MRTIYLLVAKGVTLLERKPMRAVSHIAFGSRIAAENYRDEFRRKCTVVKSLHDDRAMSLEDLEIEIIELDLIE